MKAKILNNIGLKIISLILAFALWFLVARIDNPQGKKTFNNIPVTLTHTELLEEQGKVYTVLDNTDTVRVTVWAPESNLSNIRSEDIVAEADMSRLTDINTIAITCYVQNTAYDSIASNHDNVKLSIEEKASKYIDVRYETVGEVAEGYIVNNVTPDQNRIEVSGAKSVIEKVRYALASIDVSDANSTLSANVDINFFDENNEMINKSSIKTNVGFVHMTVEVLQTKTVPVEAEFMGTPLDGYTPNGEVIVTPAEVTIAGSQAQLSGVSKVVIPEEFVNVTGADTDSITLVDLNDCLIDGIKLTQSDANTKFTVKIGIEKTSEKEVDLKTSQVEIRNLPSEFKASFVEDVLSDIKLVGPESVLKSLKDNDVKTFVDIKDLYGDGDKLIAGEKDVVVYFELPDYVLATQEIYTKLNVLPKE